MMSMEDRYYEPEDDDYQDKEEYIDDYVQFEMRKGGDLDPMEQGNFLEAMSQLGFPGEIEQFENATLEQQEQVIQYWEDVARFRGEEAYYQSL